MARSFLDRIFGSPPPTLQAALSVDMKRAEVPFLDRSVNTNYIQPYSYLPGWNNKELFDTSWSNLVERVFSVNSAIGQCMRVLAQGYPEPPPMVRVGDEEQPMHQLQALLERPNPLMSHSELMSLSIVYRAVGGNCYLHKIRGTGGQVAELWPYHAGQMWPVPSRYGWVEEYEYEVGFGDRRRIKGEDIIHLKWPIPDLARPWMGMSPLAMIAREVMSDTEATVFVYALLHNDAVPHGVITLPAGTPMSPGQADKLRNKFTDQHGGDRRGGVVILEQGAEYTRVSLNPTEMNFDALRRVPEARIAGNLGVPPIVAGLNVGLEKSTYSNYEQAVQHMTQGTFVPLWRSDGVELTQALQRDYADSPVVGYNTSLVAALQESTDSKYKRALEAFGGTVATLDEVRALIDLPPIDQVIAGDKRGTLFSYEMAAASTIAPPQPTIVDVTPAAPQLTGDSTDA